MDIKRRVKTTKKRKKKDVKDKESLKGDSANIKLKLCLKFPKGVVGGVLFVHFTFNLYSMLKHICLYIKFHSNLQIFSPLLSPAFLFKEKAPFPCTPSPSFPIPGNNYPPPSEQLTRPNSDQKFIDLSQFSIQPFRHCDTNLAQCTQTYPEQNPEPQV